MSTAPSTRTPPSEVEYPDDDGLPMADNTLQYQWIVTIVGGLQGLFAANPDVFVAGNLLWYPVEGDPKTRTAPDAMVAFGRPKGYRGSYKQWVESGIPPQVVFEVLSPGNRGPEMDRKLAFYDRFGVEEYYLFDPDDVTFSGWTRGRAGLGPIAEPNGWVSPRLGIRFELVMGDLRITGPDGKPFLTFEETILWAEAEHRQAEAERAKADAEHAKVSAERTTAAAERARADAEHARAEKLAARLRELGLDPEA